MITSSIITQRKCAECLYTKRQRFSNDAENKDLCFSLTRDPPRKNKRDTYRLESEVAEKI